MDKVQTAVHAVLDAAARVENKLNSLNRRINKMVTPEPKNDLPQVFEPEAGEGLTHTSCPKCDHAPRVRTCVGFHNGHRVMATHCGCCKNTQYDEVKIADGLKTQK